MKQLEDSDLMPFGKHEGKRMDKVPASYLDWFDTEAQVTNWNGKAVLDYIKRNRLAIDAELDEQGLIPLREK
jgi:uncharacterized protein (DUF3820 family)